MELLRTIHNRGYPPEYLQARVRVRRSYRIADWERILTAADMLEAVPPSPYREGDASRSEAAVWRSLLREVAWLYGQMDQGTRAMFMPLFACLELRTMVLCLRYKGGRNDRKVEELLSHSLLGEKVRQALMADAELPAVIDAVTGLLSAGAVRFARLKKVYRQGGLAAFERGLTDLCLAEVSAGKLHPLIREFLGRLIDARNVITLYKQIRWRIMDSSPFIKGGEIGESVLKGVAARNDLAEVTLLIRRLTGEDVPIASAGMVERHLLTAVTRFVRRRGREGGFTGLILDYLWRSYVEARNLSLLILCRNDRQACERELVQ